MLYISLVLTTFPFSVPKKVIMMIPLHYYIRKSLLVFAILFLCSRLDIKFSLLLLHVMKYALHFSSVNHLPIFSTQKGNNDDPSPLLYKEITTCICYFIFMFQVRY